MLYSSRRGHQVQREIVLSVDDEVLLHATTEVSPPIKTNSRYSRQGRKAKDRRSRDSHGNRGYTNEQHNIGKLSFAQQLLS